MMLNSSTRLGAGRGGVLLGASSRYYQELVGTIGRMSKCGDILIIGKKLINNPKKRGKIHSNRLMICAAAALYYRQSTEFRSFLSNQPHRFFFGADRSFQLRIFHRGQQIFEHRSGFVARRDQVVTRDE